MDDGQFKKIIKSLWLQICGKIKISIVVNHNL